MQLSKQEAATDHSTPLHKVPAIFISMNASKMPPMFYRVKWWETGGFPLPHSVDRHPQINSDRLGLFMAENCRSTRFILKHASAFITHVWGVPERKEVCMNTIILVLLAKLKPSPNGGIDQQRFTTECFAEMKKCLHRSVGYRKNITHYFSVCTCAVQLR